MRSHQDHGHGIGLNSTNLKFRKHHLIDFLELHGNEVKKIKQGIKKTIF